MICHLPMRICQNHLMVTCDLHHLLEWALPLQDLLVWVPHHQEWVLRLRDLREWALLRREWVLPHLTTTNTTNVHPGPYTAITTTATAPKF
jgi:hypothetical protein